MVERSATGGFEAEWVFRHCAPDHKKLDGTLEHNKEWGGRYNPAGEFGAIYVSCEESTALKELDRRAEALGLSRADMLPRMMLTLHLKLRRVLDLTDPEVRTAWGATPEEITRADDYTRCQEIARNARRDGYEAIRFPSYADRDDNYAIFLDVLKPGSDITIEDEQPVAGTEA